ncbi:twin-arginine translocase TatA/TatE family subunit [Providencia vermicola]|jgi:sec-independent protein translocase protein TatA|uniref:twin-arginine translocase TatA/TatE family subunit n=1 Tax=Providencia TaxID=586 RepID=UPI001C5BD4E7|nr:MULTISPECIES: twin-arginine translocase TatA/TatE family subunit [Providencia]MDR2226253.1 twin-arginine translocase TatA/TatE family subunit [Providencia sp.]USR65539.1 twin-arginine translocase TatA/TatE family subunit [Providencia stuartii]ELR5152699.1 twin-arginine translocase TatA/TatE family subunit [Providencia rettgeri]ELR5232241.1 twin-arginine translocase TatA/TatE family subunit [Providencia rettgeri]QXX82485.1 twin-arginine translocase TatA/TatE family subunit [Providencia sp. R
MESTIAMAAFGSPWQLIIIALLIILIFGTKKLRSLGSDLGESLKGFKKAMSDDEKAKAEQEKQDADFATKNITEQQAAEKKESPVESKNKEQG